MMLQVGWAPTDPALKTGGILSGCAVGRRTLLAAALVGCGGLGAPATGEGNRQASRRQLPSGTVFVPVGSNINDAVGSHPPGTVFLLGEGRHLGQTIHPKDGNRFFGEPGRVVLDGAGARHAFLGQGVHRVTIRGLAFTGYAPPRQGIGVLGTDSTSWDWLIEDCRFSGIALGAAIMLGSRMTLRRNHIHSNEWSGIGGWNVAGAVIEQNEIALNNQARHRPFTEESDVAGIKIAQCSDTRISGNHIHRNIASHGVWTDIDCVGTVIEGNLIDRNDGAGVMIELDHGSIIRHNLISRNNAPTLEGFLGGGVYVSTASNCLVQSNALVDNVGGIYANEEVRGAGRGGVWASRNISACDNLVVMERGLHGLAASAHLHHTNRFFANSYCFSGSASFAHGERRLSRRQWQALGQDPEASGSRFRC